MWEKMVRITESAADMHRKLVDAFYAEANDRINKRKDKALDDFKKLTYKFLVNSPTYESLVSGDLAFHFGFRKGQEESRLQPILNTFVDSVSYKFKPYSRTGGSFEFFAIHSDYSDVLSLSEAKIQGKNKDEFSVNYPLPWLNWLLLQGDDIIIKDYKIELGVLASRSGKAIMVKGGTWAVPSEFRGTANDNWVTRLSSETDAAIGSYQQGLQQIMEGLL